MDIIIFLLALSVVVVFHELGHYWAAKKTGVKVEEFGLGLPPKVWGKKFGETVFSLNWLPIGGFCRLYGENEEKKAKGKRAFSNKKPWQKMLVVMGGVVMNVVLAIMIFGVVYTVIGVPKETGKVRVLEVSAGSPAEEVGLKEGDWIVGVGQKQVKTGGELVEAVADYKGGKAELVVTAKGSDEKRVVEVRVRENPPEGEGSMGVAISTMEMVKVPWWQFYKGIAAGFSEAYFWGKIIAVGMYQMVSGLFVGKLPEGVAGPVGMYQATTSIKNNQGILAMIHFFGIISVNLAILNFLPFPALDGGRMVFVAWEMVAKRKANAKLEMMVNNVGMAILLLLLVLVTVGDVARFFG